MGLKRIAIDEELHRKVKVAASAEGISMKRWAEGALAERLRQFPEDMGHKRVPSVTDKEHEIA